MVLSLSQISPVLGGVIAGVLHTILGPDHLCTIVTLSACQGAEAFWFGVRWAGGHLAGMAVIGCLFAMLSAANLSNLNLEAYEHVAYYCVGCLLMSMGAYFIIYADKYFDAEWSPKQKSCACHAALQEPIAPSCNEDTSYGSGDVEGHHHHNHNHEHHSEKNPALKITGMRESGSMLIGFAQGIACPAGVVGMVFLKQYTPVQMVVFIAMFFIVTTLAMGGLAMSYGMLTRSCISSKVLGRSIYYASCALSLVLGAAWVFLNATGRLDALLGHDHSHGSHAGHDHAGHNHAHMFNQMPEDGRLPDLLLLSR